MTAQPATHPRTAHRLTLPDAELYYEVRGAGPLLLVVGQPMSSGPFAPVADALADRWTVVTYDPRGVGRSTVADKGVDVTPEVEADDLAAIIDALGGGPADVVGSSGGAVAGLALVVRHPDAVGTLIAHEPPVVELLPDAVHVRAAVDGIRDAYLTEGPGAAWGRFVSLVMHDGPMGPDGVQPAAWPPPGVPAGDDAAGDGQGGDDVGDPDANPAPDDELFFLHMLAPFTRWLPPVDTLRAHGGVVVAVGEASHAEMPRRSADVLAERLGATPVPFPGDHGGFMADPAGFAEAIRAVLTRTP
jgi:pimeloyl-ACP methyl ester carboxylesterase